MILFPAIDLVGGQVVRLRQGRRSELTVYDDDPARRARAFRDAGASWVHVVDLSAAFGEDASALRANRRAIAAICEVEGLSVDVGGGVRDLARVEELLELGCSRVSLGTPIVKDPDFVTEALGRFGPALVADVAAAGDAVRVDGWREGAEVSLDELLGRLAPWGFGHLVFTDVDLDGTGSGIDPKRYREVAARVGFPVVASGGVTSMFDLMALAALGDDVLEGIIVGRAIYEGTVDLATALTFVESGALGQRNDFGAIL